MTLHKAGVLQALISRWKGKGKKKEKKEVITTPGIHN